MTASVRCVKTNSDLRNSLVDPMFVVSDFISITWILSAARICLTDSDNEDVAVSLDSSALIEALDLVYSDEKVEDGNTGERSEREEEEGEPTDAVV